MVAHEKRNSAQLFCAVPTRNDLALSSLLFFRPTHTKVGIPPPDVLPESVLRHFGHSERPAGKLGEGALFSLKAYSEAEKKGHVKSAKEFFGETNNWNEIGYITTDGTKLDFSGRHEGAPGGQTGRRGDGRDRRGAV